MRAEPTSLYARLWVRLRLSWRRFRASLTIEPPASSVEQPRLWLLALAVGALSGYAALGFVLAIRSLQWWIYGAPEEELASAAATAPVWLLIAAPIITGAIMGALLRAFPNETPLGVADVMQARALRQGRMSVRSGLISVFASVLSLSGGGSAGREGPAVVAGGAIASAVSNRLKVTAFEARTVLGCAVAAAVSASFNAPIAGALFSLEVVLGHYAIRAFAPITIASVAGAVISRTYLGDEPAFLIPQAAFGSYAQFPAFLLLGLCSAATAIIMIGSIFLVKDAMDEARKRLGAPLWTQPIAAGAMLGVIAVFFPHIIGVGYQTATEALSGQFDIWTCVIFAVVKTIAVAITLGGRFAGGVFSPALLLGALVGSAFGSVALMVFPSVEGSQALYALAGMGAVAGAVLGAPISTTLIVFELTGDYDTAVAVMVSTSVSTVLTQQVIGKSFFHIQLARRRLNLSAGPQTFLLPSLKVRGLMRARGAEDGASDTRAWELVRQGAFLTMDDTLDTAFPKFANGKLPFLPVIEAPGAVHGAEETAGPQLVGALFYVDALKAYNRALVEMHAEEHT
ncbi:MAG: chloride channel protein [Pseudomonadota bacterium]